MWNQQLERKEIRRKTHPSILFVTVGTQQQQACKTRWCNLVPKEARRTRNGSFDYRREPASPRISCLGEIKEEKMMKQQQQDEGKESRFGSCFGHTNMKKEKGKLKKQSDSDKQKKQSCSLAAVVPEKSVVPSLGELKRFTSGRRDSSFDWIAVTSRDDDRSRG
ncbi:hypothetical protein LINGRAHAP2_LOCUS31144 [Linum grandiflorum]